MDSYFLSAFKPVNNYSFDIEPTVSTPTKSSANLFTLVAKLKAFCFTTIVWNHFIDLSLWEYTISSLFAFGYITSVIEIDNGYMIV